MFNNYFKTAWRSLGKNKAFSVLNILGLSVGMAATCLILLWVQQELSFDREYANTDRLYQVYNRDVDNGAPYTYAATPNPMGPALKAGYPEIEDVTRVSGEQFLIANQERQFKPEGLFVDEGFVSMFGFPVMTGDRRGLLRNPGDIFITRSLARKLYGSDDAVGKLLTLNDSNTLRVAAVLENAPAGTRFRFEFLLPWAYYDKLYGVRTSWTGNNVRTYVLLRKNADPAAADRKIKNITAEHTTGESTTKKLTQFLHPAQRWHLYSKSENGALTDGAIGKVRIFMAVALLMIIIACINFVNLSTARTAHKAREVGVRKVAGARRSGLVLQFLSESICLSLLSGVLAIAGLLLALPAFNGLIESRLQLHFTDFRLWLFFGGIILLTGVGAGLYPALYLSSFVPVKVLKGAGTTGKGRIGIRKILVVTQFAFAIALITCTLIIKKQMKYAQQRETGYNKELLLFSPIEGMAKKNYALIKQALLKSGAVTTVAGSQNPVTGFLPNYYGFHWEGSTERDENTSFYLFNADEAFTKTFGTKIIAGRDMDIERFPTDSTAVLLNEEAVKLLHLKDPVGKRIWRGAGDLDLHIVGVVKNYISGSPYGNIQPMMILGANPALGVATLHYKLDPANPVQENIARIAAIFKRYNPGYPFEYRFADQDYAEQFAGEQNLSRLIGLFAALSIFIACLGLFGLAAYMAETRYKEIGIRKVLGASVPGILLLLTKDFIRPIVTALLVAAPVAWWIMNRWLQEYSYRTAIGWTVFLAAGSVVLCVALITIVSQTIRAALSNPSKALRSE
ncbi:duplicated orphan permease [Niabella drilacis]|uniref:Duplicated orphan permease n=2 Tax=Niabella drilacis (strain DSM 25811 / CCM 8410 / CCUG 62505 / LMG 26954 / E90) TaxID=1285928 RepID=A0A1G7AHZ6_NIADE|nr:duplicated orphan permease [Niabella drilacis]